MSIAQRVIIITGASTGIGRACALGLKQDGFRVFAGVRRETDARELEGLGLDTAIIDVTSKESIARARDAIETALGESDRLAGLVNNAGIALAAPLEAIPLDDLRRQFEVNVIGLVAATQAFLPLLRRDHGRLVNIGSVSGYLATPLTGPYAASKFALEAISDTLRLELAPWDIPVSLVQPGPIDTPIWDKSRAEAEGLRERIGEEARRLYGPLIDAVERAVAATARGAIPAEAVVRAVRHALMARRPRTRYLVGRHARMQRFLARRLPDRLRDWVILRVLGRA